MAPPANSFLLSLLCFAKLCSFLQARSQYTFTHKAIFFCTRQSPLLHVLCPHGLLPACLSLIKLLYSCPHVTSILEALNDLALFLTSNMSSETP